jgi:CBS domain containing-hemolysin-like protein
MMSAAKPFLKKKNLPRITEEEIKMMLKLGKDAGTVGGDEEILCNRVFKLNDIKAYQMMRPFSQIYALPSKSSLRDLKDVIISSRFSRIAVYDKSPLDIVGIIQQRVLLREIAKDNYEALVQDFMTEPIFISSLTRADTLLEKFRTYHQHLFIVQDEKGANIGLITMEDVLEEIFGEIFDEKDTSV